jgi:large subunit ribosomal protein L34e
MPAVRPKESRGLKKRQRKVARAYGGSRCSTCVRKRIVRAFLIEEHKIVQSVIRQRSAAK